MQVVSQENAVNNWQLYIAAGLPTLAVLLSIWRADKRMDGLDARIDRLASRLDGRFNKIDDRFNKVDGRLDKVDDRFDRLETRMDSRFDKVDADLRHLFELYGRHDEAIETLKKRPG
jgi:tetrahydromethanopterin S-methyltransferase subunit G